MAHLSPSPDPLVYVCPSWTKFLVTPLVELPLFHNSTSTKIPAYFHRDPDHRERLTGVTKTS